MLKPVSLHEFIHAEYPVGLGASYDIIDRLINDNTETLLIWTEVTKRPGWRPEKAAQETLYIVQDKTAPTGNTAEAGLRKLRKAASEGNEDAQRELAKVVAGDETRLGLTMSLYGRLSSQSFPSTPVQRLR